MDGKIIHFHYDIDNRLLAETTETGTPIREYIYAANQRIAMVDYQSNTNGDLFFMVNDHLGTPQLLVDAAQQVVWSVKQSPFGEVTVNGDVEQPLRFPGQYADSETGYSYNYFRDYDPTLGRYIESDPIGLEAGVNTFGYVMGNPVLKMDLNGLLESDVIREWNNFGKHYPQLTANMSVRPSWAIMIRGSNSNGYTFYTDRIYIRASYFYRVLNGQGIQPNSLGALKNGLVHESLHSYLFREIGYGEYFSNEPSYHEWIRKKTAEINSWSEQSSSRLETKPGIDDYPNAPQMCPVNRGF